MPKRGFPHDSFFKVPNAVLGTKEVRGWIHVVGPIGYSIYSVILMRYDYQRREGWYESQESMARLLDITVPTFEKHVEKLRKVGLVDRIHYGKKRHDQWIYVPRLPIPPVPVEVENKQSPLVMVTQTDSVKAAPLPKMTGSITKDDEEVEMVESARTKSIKVSPERPIRLSKRLYKDMSPEDQVTYVLKHLDQVESKRQVQVAFNYWCYLWERHYGRPYYAAKRRENSRIIPKDKKNLRDKIGAVGFEEVVARMRRCVEVCDKTFPCVQYGEWIQPIGINDFVNNRFFDRWIPQPGESHVRVPKSATEKVEKALERKKRAAGPRETDAKSGG